MILLIKFKKNKLEKGFTLIEMLVVLFILAVLFSISVYGASCYIKSTDYKERYSNAELLQTSVLNYVSDLGGSYPVGDSAEAEDKLVVDSFLNSMNSMLLDTFKDNYKYFIYEIDSSKLNIDERLNTSDIDDYFIFYVEEDNSQYKNIKRLLKNKLLNNGAGEEEVDKKVNGLLKSLNGTILFREYLSTCSADNLENFVSGKSLYNGVSEGLKFEISDDFIDCPNDGICSNSDVPS